MPTFNINSNESHPSHNAIIGNWQNSLLLYIPIFQGYGVDYNISIAGEAITTYIPSIHYDYTSGNHVEVPIIGNMKQSIRCAAYGESISTSDEQALINWLHMVYNTHIAPALNDFIEAIKADIGATDIEYSQRKHAHSELPLESLCFSWGFFIDGIAGNGRMPAHSKIVHVKHALSLHA
jgi:hypothetical protein